MKSGERLLTRQELSRAVTEQPDRLIRAEEQRYAEAVARTASALREHTAGRGIVMLSGPSSAGKTTTSLLLCRVLAQQGIDTHVVSLDNFYRGQGNAPQLPDGSYDYECVEALDLDRLTCCLRELLQDGVSELPVFDFVQRQPAEVTQVLQLKPHSLVIFEGIHALNPLFEEHLPKDAVQRVFVNTLSPFWDGEEKLLARRDIRLLRRLLRDYLFRNSSLENTLSMWRQVVRGERLYLFPYADSAAYRLDTTHAYEPFLFAKDLLPLLTAQAAGPFSDTVEALREKLSLFVPPLSPAKIPPRSLLREFFGGETG